jgi:D-3-phosphoglycerate dehydrogenase
VERAGGAPAKPDNADAIVWTDPADAAGLQRALAASPARWVQLPFAGIERFVAEGVVDGSRIWTCAKGIYGPAVAEQVVALLLAAARQIHRHVAVHEWLPDSHEVRHRRLAGTTALVVGTGGIGRSLAGLLRPFAVRILAVNRSGAPMPGAVLTRTVETLPELVPEADWVVLAAAMTPKSRHVVDAPMLARVKRGAWIVNVGRGGLVDTEALVAALRDGRIAGAALDVTDPEPLPAGHPLWTMKNVIITSHTANTFRMAAPELASLVERNVAHFARGEPLEGLVDPVLGY